MTRGSSDLDAETTDNARQQPPRPDLKENATEAPTERQLGIRTVKSRETPVPLPTLYQSLTRSAAPRAPSISKEATPGTTGTETPTAAESPLDQLLKVLAEIASERNLVKTSESKVHSMLFFKCKLPAYKAGAEVVAHFSRELLPRLGEEWNDTPFRAWLENVSRRPLAPPEHIVPEKMASYLVRRARNGPRATPSQSTGDSLPASVGTKGKTGKVARPEGKDELGDDPQPKRRGRKSGKAASLRLMSASKKRLASEMEMDNELEAGSRRGRKSVKLTHPTSDEDDEMEDVNGASVSPGPLDDEDDDGDSDAYPIPPPKDAVRIVVRAERVPTMSPTGPNGTWVCDQEGCGYVVRSAEEQASQALIQEHFRRHEAQLEKIDLAMKESRGHMPIKYAYFPPILLVVKFAPAHERALRQNSRALSRLHLGLRGAE